MLNSQRVSISMANERDTTGDVINSFNKWEKRQSYTFPSYELCSSPQHDPAWKNVTLTAEVPQWSRLPIMEILAQEKIAFQETQQAKKKEAKDLEEVKARLAEELANTESPEEFLEKFLEYLSQRQGEGTKKR